MKQLFLYHGIVYFEHSSEFFNPSVSEIKEYEKRFEARSHKTTDGSSDDAFIINAVESAYKLAIAKGRVRNLPSITIGPVEGIVRLMKQRISGTPQEKIDMIQRVRNDGQFSRFGNRQSELFNISDRKDTEWPKVENLFVGNGGVFTFHEDCFCVRSPNRFDDQTPIWDESFPCIKYEPVFHGDSVFWEVKAEL